MEGILSHVPKLSTMRPCYWHRHPMPKVRGIKLLRCHATAFPHLLVNNRGLVNLDTRILFTSVGASASLVSACALIAWMQNSGLLPKETPAILSQVAFRIMIPCYLMSKVSSVLATQSTQNVAVVPLIAVCQVLLGASMGKIACMLLYHGSKLPGKILAKKKALVTTACAFGNTLSLPMVFLTGILHPKDASLAAGYLALFMVGWSPALWTVAYHILTTSAQGLDNDGGSDTRVFHKWYTNAINPPLCGVILGMIVGCIRLLREETILPRLLHPVYDAGALLGSAAPGVQVTVLACSLAGVIKSPTMNVIDSKEVLVIGFVRALLVPLVSCIALSLVEEMQLLTLDPICKLTLLVLSAMPSAQNLVVVAQLRPSTRPLAKELASLLLLQYVGSLVPITLWLAVFLAINK